MAWNQEPVTEDYSAERYFQDLDDARADGDALAGVSVGEGRP